MTKTQQVLATVFATIAGMFALTQLYDWYVKASYDIEVTAETQDFVVPKSWQDFGRVIGDDDDLEQHIIEDLRSSHDEFGDGSEFEVSREDKRGINRATSAVGLMVPNGFPGRWTGRSYGSHAKLLITNTGTKESTDLRVKLFDADYVQLRFPNGDWTIHDPFLGEVLEIGKLLPGEAVFIHVWDSSIFERDLEKIRVFHGEGYVDADIYETVGPFWAGVADNWIFISIEVTLVLFLLFLYAIASGRPSTTEEKPKEDQAGAEKTDKSRTESDQDT